MPARGFTIWLTGLPCSGKSTIASLLAKRLVGEGVGVEIFDGDIVRENLSKGLGFSREDRDTNIRRIGFVAKLLTRNGAAPIVAAISPYRALRDEVRSTIGDFIEVHVDCPVDECERRDVKGMYAQARAGKRQNFTGVDDPYEPPESPEVVVRTRDEDVGQSVDKIVACLRDQGYLEGRGDPDPAWVQQRLAALGLDR